jgi:hypothetical protein
MAESTTCTLQGLAGMVAARGPSAKEDDRVHYGLLKAADTVCFAFFAFWISK